MDDMKPEYVFPLIHGDDSMSDFWARTAPKPSLIQEIRNYWEDNHDFRNHAYMVGLTVLTFIAGIILGVML